MQLLHPNATNSGTVGAGTTALPPTTAGGSAVWGSGGGAGMCDGAPRVAVLTQQGGMLIVDIEGFQLRSVGFYTVKVSRVLCHMVCLFVLFFCCLVGTKSV